MEILTHTISTILLLGGVAFLLISGVGVLRFPDLFTRMHASGILDTLGSGLILGGLMFLSDSIIVTVKLILVLILSFFTSPVSTHALARAALTTGVHPKEIQSQGKDDR